MILRLFLLLFLVSCGEVEPVPDCDPLPEKKVWVCHNPESKYHGKECDNGFKPGKCLEAGNNNKFCWLLDTDLCFSDQDLPYNEICNQI